MKMFLGRVPVATESSVVKPQFDGDEDDILEHEELLYRLADQEQELYELRLEVEELKESLSKYKMKEIFNHDDYMISKQLKDYMLSNSSYEGSNERAESIK